MSSSDLPENMTPAMTSIQPGRVPWNMGAYGSGGWGVGQGSLGILRFFEGVPHIVLVFQGFLGCPPVQGRFCKAFSTTSIQECAMNKAELTAAFAMRTKMSKADAGLTIEALFDDKGIIAGELKKGAKVQITRFGNFEDRKGAAPKGRNP